MKLTFLGLGHMGQGMAACLLRAGNPLTVYNRTAEKCASLTALGAESAATAAEAARGADIVFSMLADDAALAALVDDVLLSAMAPGAVHVSMSTVSTRITDEMTAKHARHQRGFLACPVFGRPDAAADGTLRLCLAGPAEEKERVRPLLAFMGEVWDFGAIPSGAVAVKLAGNFMLSTLIETLSEAYSFTEKHGVAPESFYNLMSNTLLAAPAVKLYGRLILDARFDEAGFAAALGAKDIGLVRDAARRSRTPMPIAALVEDRFLRLLARGWGKRDWSVLSRLQREDAGLP